MRRLIRPLAVFGFSTVFSMSMLLLLGAPSSSGGPMDAAAFNLGGGYDLGRLKLLKETMGYVTETYVDPERIDFERMYVSALEAVERQIPEAMFHREDGLLHVHVVEYRSVFSVERIDSAKRLEDELKRVAEVLRDNLAEDDIPETDIEFDRFAQIEYTMVNGVLETLDPHSVLLPPVQSELMDVDNQGEFGGLGITIVDRDGRLTIEYPLKDTPADRAGLQPDDHIVRIEGESTINMTLEEAVGRLRGRVGSEVVIEIMREGLNQPREVRITRAKIKLNPVEGEVLEGGIGYVSIPSFHAKVHGDLSDLLRWMERETGGIQGLVLDLRGNPGGYLTQAVAVADAFVASGEIVSTVGPHESRRQVSEAHSQNTERNYPIVVLVNANSASASEIVAGALRNNGRAVIVGERTFGKGSVQNLHPMNYDSKLKITVAQYFTPGERSIQSVGIPADIELIPSVIKPRDAEEGREEDFASLHYRERVRREVDLDKHLERTNFQPEDPAYSVRYVEDPDRSRRRTGDLELSDDYEVQFALDILTASGSAKRAEILLGVESVVAGYTRDSALDLEAAFDGVGIDWSDGVSPTSVELDVRFDQGDDGRLIAGEEELVTLEVTNLGEEPLYRLVALGAEHELLDNREFFFGRLDPGETRSWQQRVRVDEGYPSEVSAAVFRFRDASTDEVAEHRTRVEVVGHELPRFAWSWWLEAEEGGEIEMGAPLKLTLEVENVGQGVSNGAVARIKNRSGRSLDIVTGTIEPGVMRDADGLACTVLEAGVEAGAIVGEVEAGNERVEADRPPVYASDCERVLAPGESWTGAFTILLKEDNPEGYELDLSLGDGAAYDLATVVRSGFYSYFMQSDTLRFPALASRSSARTADAETGGQSERRQPPEIVITRPPALEVEDSVVTVSGAVSDDEGLSNVVIYAGGDKIFFQGGSRDEALRRIPFTADVQLEPGQNTISVLSTDSHGLTSTRSLVTFYNSPDSHAGL
jgi:carboxyl-terminal processing protease